MAEVLLQHLLLAARRRLLYGLAELDVAADLVVDIVAARRRAPAAEQLDGRAGPAEAGGHIPDLADVSSLLETLEQPKPPDELLARFAVTSLASSFIVPTTGRVLLLIVSQQMGMSLTQRTDVIPPPLESVLIQAHKAPHYSPTCASLTAASTSRTRTL